MADDAPNLNRDTIALTHGGKTSRLLRPGDIVGESYRLKNLIGRGGMGYVFRAEHIMIGHDYALKVLAPDQVNEVTWNRFQAEGRAIARLDHPNIVKIYNMGVDKGDCPYYVMDLLEGVNLADCISDKMSFSVDEILDMFMQLAEGFGYAHSRGIIHRDVKPGNVVLVNEGGQYARVKIVDFGIAKLAGKSDLQLQSLTATGEVFGSPYYMSPEQCLGTEIDQRSDIYSLGCTLFEVLCGRPPFVGEGPMQTVLMHQNKPSPTIESVGGKYSSEEMEAVVARMLMKRPADRYQSMEQVFHDLERIWQRKGVGKNVETGFKSSVETQLEDFGQRAEIEEENKGKLKKVFITAVVSSILFGLLVSGYFGILALRKASKVTDIKLAVSVEQKEADEKKALSKEVLPGTEKLARVRSLASIIDRSSGKKFFRFPQINMGQICWSPHTGPIPRKGPEFYTAERVEAKGDVLVPADQPLGFNLNSGRNREVWLNPAVLSKFGPDEMTALRLDSDDVVTEEVQQYEYMVRILTAVTSWTGLQTIELVGCPLQDRALLLLDRFPRLTSLTVRNTTFNAKCLAKRRCMSNLTSLLLCGDVDADSVLEGLKGSKNIQFVELDRCSLSYKGLAALSDCPHLMGIVINNVKLGDKEIDALSHVKSLIWLAMTGAHVQPQSMPYLAKLSGVRTVLLDMSGWPERDVQQLKQYLPRINIKWKGKKEKLRPRPDPQDLAQ
jgi:serine/threonine protein kinase